MRQTNNIQAHIIKFRKSLIFGPTLLSFDEVGLHYQVSVVQGTNCPFSYY